MQCNHGEVADGIMFPKKTSFDHRIGFPKHFPAF